MQNHLVKASAATGIVGFVLMLFANGAHAADLTPSYDPGSDWAGGMATTLSTNLPLIAGVLFTITVFWFVVRQFRKVR